MSNLELIHGDRRTDRRYAFDMPLKFSGRSGAGQCSGSGRTKDLGRKGIRFVAENPPPPSAEVELRVAWPFLLQGVCALELRLWGRVLRSDEHGTVVQTNKYEFRTCGERSFDQAGSSATVNWSIVA